MVDSEKVQWHLEKCEQHCDHYLRLMKNVLIPTVQ